MIVNKIYIMHLTLAQDAICICAFTISSAVAHLWHLDSLYVYPENLGDIEHACVGVMDRGLGGALLRPRRQKCTRVEIADIWAFQIVRYFHSADAMMIYTEQ